VIIKTLLSGSNRDGTVKNTNDIDIEDIEFVYSNSAYYDT